MKIKIIDAICGAGKTSYAIQLMNETTKLEKGISRGDKKYIYVTPFLSEVERVVHNTKAEFSEPVGLRGSKFEHVKMLIENEKNIVMTHKLFSKLDEDTLSDIEMTGYTLIMDEVANVLERVSIEKQDIDVMFSSKLIEVGENKKVKWIADSYIPTEISRFRDIKILADKDNLFLERDSVFFWVMDVKSFTCFKEVYVLTYMFDGQLQKYYYDLLGVDYDKYSVLYDGNKYYLSEYKKEYEPREKIKGLLKIYEDSTSEGRGRKTNFNSNYILQDSCIKNKKEFYYLSTSWFIKAKEKEIDQLRKNLYNYFRTYLGVGNDELYWTTSKSIAPYLKSAKAKFNKNDNRAKDNFLSMNARATNDYANRNAMAYVYNRFMNPLEKSFFENRGVKVNQDLLAVSDLVQFLFRGCIRNNEPMDCYIPAPRMRQLLYDWMEFKI